MGQPKEISIKLAYYSFEDMVNIEDFHSNLLKINKKLHRDIDIYYIGYLVIKKIDEYENIHSMNQLYLIIHSATGYFKEKMVKKYLIIYSTEKDKEVFSEIRSEIEMLNNGKKLYYEKDYVRIGINTNDDLPSNAALNFPTLTIIIRCILQKDKKFYPQIYLSKCLFEL